MITPRFSGAVNKDNTDRLLKRDYQAPAFAATIAIAIKAACGYSLINVGNLTGATTISINVGDASNPPMVGDKVEILFYNAAGTASVVTFGTGFAPTGTLSVTASKAAQAQFIFNGTAWLQVGSAVAA